MTTKKAQTEAVLDCPKTKGKFTLYPATFGLLEWLQSARKNPVVCGGEVSIDKAIEVCFAFTRTSAEVVAMPAAKLTAALAAFKNALTPAEYKTIETHAQRELMKFFRTSVVPKKHPAAAKPKRK